MRSAMTIKLLHKKETLILMGVVALGALLRIVALSYESLRLDEAQSVWQASHSTEFIRLYMLKNVHLPLHNTMLHGWIRLFGAGELAVRFLSVIFGVLSLPALYFLARKFLNRQWALFTVFIGAIAPFWIWYSREIRMYSMLTFIVTLSYLLFIKILEEPRRRWYVLYTLVNLVGIYTHYFFLHVLLVQAIFFFLTWKIPWDRSRPTNIPKKTEFLRLLFIAFILFLSFLPWIIGLFMYHGSGTYGPSLTRPRGFNMILTLFEAMLGYHPDAITTILIALWPIAILLAFAFLAKRNPFSPKVGFLMLGVVVPIVLTFFVSYFVIPMYLSRYLIVITPFLYIFLAWFASALTGKTKPIFIGSLVALIAGALLLQYFHPESPARENYRDAVKFVSERATAYDAVVISPPYLIYPFEYYYRGNGTVFTVPIWDKRKGGIPTITADGVKKDVNTIQLYHKKLYLLLATDLYGAMEVKAAFDNSFRKLEKRQFSRTVWVHVYDGYFGNDEEVPLGAPSDGIYTIVKGDTLYEIAGRFELDPQAYTVLIQLNAIANPNLIHEGASLKIPGL
ncbi:MAG: glycosyltransferase family 39 protein [bacterium]|nr:glycosyltransferase family 39 protein [bacterium]